MRRRSGLSFELTGYRGEALKVLTGANASIGDCIRIRRGNEVYEGILIPRTEYGDDKHILIKIASGYNIGLHVTPDMKVEVIGVGAKPTFIRPPLPVAGEGLPKVAVISTGGTIASRVDYRTGAVKPALSAEDLYSVVPELSSIAKIEAHILYSEFSENITPEHWREMSIAIAKRIEEGAEGVVVCHGTDTLGYTAAALSFALRNLPVPVVLVGSQRSSDRPSSDAASNLTGAVAVAATSPFAEVVVAMHESPSDEFITIHRGTKVRKCHTSRRDTFKSINSTPLARFNVREGKIEMLAEDCLKRSLDRKVDLRPNFNDKVILIKFYPGMNSKVIDLAVDLGYRGIILEGTGLGHVSRYCYRSIERSVESGLLVGMTSQCLWGRVNMNVYYTGRDLLALGVVPLEDMLPETALVKMMWAFGQTDNVREAKEIMTTNIAGEFSPRRGMEAQ
jgi:glutamyl-tRNA(Gln) amidotransferase subunit D